MRIIGENNRQNGEAPKDNVSSHDVNPSEELFGPEEIYMEDYEVSKAKVMKALAEFKPVQLSDH